MSESGGAREVMEYTNIVLIPKMRIAKKALTMMSIFHTPTLSDAKPKRTLPMTPVTLATMILEVRKESNRDRLSG